jgi:hypothetical protein
MCAKREFREMDELRGELDRLQERRSAGHDDLRTAV